MPKETCFQKSNAKHSWWYRKNISNKMIVEIKSEDIGEMVMERLKNVDEVSYVRFASVYRQFKDINTFMEEIKNLMK